MNVSRFFQSILTPVLAQVGQERLQTRILDVFVAMPGNEVHQLSRSREIS